jgi:membrane fusion protein, multidrug efflux system
MTDIAIVQEIAPKTKKNREERSVDFHEEHVARHSKQENMKEHNASEADSPPPKPGRRPWVWALMGAAAVAATAAGIAYYLHSLSFESTDDAFIEAHIAPVSSRVSP